MVWQASDRVRRAARAAAVVAIASAAAVTADAQRLLDYTPNTRPAWTMPRWQPAMVLSHRLELVSGGDELLNVPLMTFGLGVTDRFAIGLDYTSNSEVTVAGRGGNETQWWLATRAVSNERAALSALLGYNTAAASVDGGLTMRARAGMMSLVGEARAFSDAFGTGGGGFAGSGGAVLHVTPYLTLGGDLGRAFRPDTFGTVWSAGFTLALPGTRHHFSFHATNGGAPTLQGASRRKVIGAESVRYGFAFVAPLGTGSQWARIFRRAEPAPAGAVDASGVVRVNIKDLAFTPGTIRIKPGQTVEWVNADPLAHTVTADDKSWGSGFIDQGATYSRKFAAAGTFPYHCEPHPQMKGVVVVEP